MPTKPSKHRPTTAPKRTYGWADDRIRGTQKERGYGKEWKKLRRHIMDRDDRLCQPCLAEGRLSPASQVDHIVPKAEGGSDSDDNLQAICLPCHRYKTAHEGLRARGGR